MEKERSDSLDDRLDKIIRAHEAAIARIDRQEARMDRHEVLLDRHEALMNRQEARMDRLEARFEKRMKGFEKLVAIGLKQLTTLARLQKESSEKINMLIDSQQRTEAALRSLLSSLRKGPNGRQ